MGMATILVTGAAGYIGTHTVVELLAAGHAVVALDNYANSTPIALDRVERIAGRALAARHAVDLCDETALRGVFARHRIDAVIHFAGLKAVGESVQQPLRYYRNNLIGTLNLLAAMDEAGCRDLVFSSSATVYGDPERLPVTEDCRLRTTNPYGATKLMIEDQCRDLAKAGPWRIVLLRYFNPVGAHPGGTIGEDPSGIPNNLMPFVMQVAVGRRPEVQIFGGDWPTPDGTGVRDYIHVVDLAKGHLAALAALPRLPGCTAINLGTGRGVSVLEMVKAAGRACGRDLPHRIVARRPGDIAACWADPSTAERLLGWKAALGLDAMCADHWRWQSANPQGYRAG